MVATGFETAGFGTTGPSAACFSVRGFDETTGFAAGFGEAACFGDLAGFDEPWKMFDSQPASLFPIGSSTDTAIAAMTVRQLALNLALASFLTDGNCCIPAS